MAVLGMACGTSHSICVAQKQDGSYNDDSFALSSVVYTWGHVCSALFAFTLLMFHQNDAGQLGDGTTQACNIPLCIQSLSDQRIVGYTAT